MLGAQKEDVYRQRRVLHVRQIPEKIVKKPWAEGGLPVLLHGFFVLYHNVCLFCFVSHYFDDWISSSADLKVVSVMVAPPSSLAISCTFSSGTSSVIVV